MPASLIEPVGGAFLDYGGAVYNVTHDDFGAKGDGVTDDLAAIQAAVAAANAAGGGTVYFPPGTYLVGHASGNIEPGNNVTLAGAGWGSIIKASSVPSLSTAQGLIRNEAPYNAGGGNNNIVIRDLAIDMADLGTAPQGKGLILNNVDGFLVDNVRVVNCKSYGIWIWGGAKNGRVISCHVEDAEESIELYQASKVAVIGCRVKMVAGRSVNGILLWDDAATSQMRDCVVQGCVVEGDGGDGITFGDGTGRCISADNHVRVTGANSKAMLVTNGAEAENQITGGHYYAEFQSAIRLEANATDVTIAGARVDGWLDAIYCSSAALRAVISGCHIKARSAANTLGYAVNFDSNGQCVIDGCYIEVTNGTAAGFAHVAVLQANCIAKGNIMKGGRLKVWTNAIAMGNQVIDGEVQIDGNDSIVAYNILAGTTPALVNNGTGNDTTGNKVV